MFIVAVREAALQGSNESGKSQARHGHARKSNCSGHVCSLHRMKLEMPPRNTPSATYDAVA